MCLLLFMFTFSLVLHLKCLISFFSFIRSYVAFTSFGAIMKIILLINFISFSLCQMSLGLILFFVCLFIYEFLKAFFLIKLLLYRIRCELFNLI